MPIRLAGTWRRYSKKAIPQLRRMIRNRGFPFMFFRWPYQAKVMNKFDNVSNSNGFST